MPGLETHAHAVDLGAGLAKKRQACVVVADVQADFSQDPVGRGFDLLQVFLAHDVVGRYAAPDVCRARQFGVGVTPFAATGAALALGLGGQARFRFGDGFVHGVCPG